MLSFILTVMVYHEYLHFNKAIKLEQKGKKIFAIDYYGYVIICYVPFSPYIEQAEKKILKIGKYFEDKNKLYNALFAYEVLRASYFQVRSFYQPREDMINKLNYKIADIKVKILKSENRLKNEKKEFKRQLKILQHNNFPSTIGSLIMCLSFLCWIGAIIYMIMKGFEKEKADKKVILVSSGAIAAGLRKLGVKKRPKAKIYKSLD